MRYHVSNPTINMLCGQPVQDGWVELQLASYMQPLVESGELVPEERYVAAQLLAAQTISEPEQAADGARNDAAPLETEPVKAKFKK